MAHVREVERKGGRAFEVRWRENGRERQRSFTQRREAERYAARIEVDQADGRSTEPLAGRSKTVADVVEASLAASRPKLKASTLAGYEALYAKRILPTFGKKRIAAVTSEDVERWVARLVAEGLSSSTIHNYWVALSKLWTYAMRHRLVATNPCAAIELPRAGNRATFEPVFLTAAQVEAVAGELDAWHPYGLLIRFVAATGLRAAEVAGLRIKDVDLVAGHVRVEQTIRRVRGVWTTTPPKSKTSRRSVPLLSRALIADLREFLLAHPNSGDPEALFWPARSNGSRRLDYSRPIDCGGVRNYYLAPAVRRLGVAEHMRFHDLRHTYASLMLAAGFQPFVIARHLGHQSLDLLARTYGHLYPSDYQSEIAQFERFIAQQ